MVDVEGVRAIGEPGVEWAMRSQQPYDDPKRRLDQMAPLLHELIAFDLVQRDEDGNFVLRQDVQERLAALTTDRPYRSAEVFVGRKCQGCGSVKLTRMVDGQRVCSSCARAALAPATVVDPASVDGKVSRGFFHRHRRAS